MAKFIFLFAILCVVSNGCGKSEVAETESISMPELTPTTPTSPSPAQSSSPTPPGKIELPKGADLNATPPTSSGPKESTIKLPPMTPEATITVQRPVLDEGVAQVTAGIAESPANMIVLTAATLAAVQDAVAQSGQVCVVDFWSLGCEPCLKEFPGLVKLHNDFSGKVTCFSVNTDYDGRKSKPADTYRPRVEAFLKLVDASFENFLSLTPSEDVYASLKIVSIPAVLVYDANGTLVSTFTDTGDDIGFTYEKNIAPLVKSLVTK